MKIPFSTGKPPFLLILLSISTLLFFFNRGFLPHDEGYILHSAQRILEGEVVYKDFHFIYTPGSIFLTALSFKILGESILAGRILMLLISLITSFVIYITIARITRNSLLSLLAILVYLSWGPTHINFPWPVMFSLLSGCLTCCFFVIAIDKQNKPFYFLAGVAAALTFLFKQNFGAAVLINSALLFLFVKEASQLKFFIYYILGIVSAILVFFVYLLSTNSFVPLLNDLYLYTIKKILQQGALSTPFVYDERLIKKILKTFFYLFPLILSSLAILSAYIHKSSARKYFFLNSFCLLFYLFGIRPITDYVHLSPLLALTGIPLAITAFQFRHQVFQLFICVVSFVLIALGFYTALFRGYYRWETPLIRQNRFISSSRLKVFTDNKYSNVIPKLISSINKQTSPDSYIFVYYYAPTFYFIADRKNPTMFNEFTHGMSSREQELELIESLESKRVEIVLTHTPIKQRRDLPVAEYILQNYKPIEKVYEYTLWRKMR